MIDKTLVKKRFSKSLITYEDNAIIQKSMAEKLIRLLDKKHFDNIFEIGCATGLLTKEINKKLTYKTLTTNDIVSKAKKYIEEVSGDINFISGDIEELEINTKYDLIISNASLQWCNDIETTINKLINSLSDNGILAISIFGDDNFKEIKNIFNIENKNYNFESLKNFLTKYNAQILVEKDKLTFSSLFEILKHIQKTGVNAIKESTLTKSQLKTLEENYKKCFSIENSLTLTYEPVYIIVQKNDIE